jgi:hypothetical protein
VTQFVTKCSGEWCMFAHVKEEITQRLYVMVTECVCMRVRQRRG